MTKYRPLYLSEQITIIYWINGKVKFVFISSLSVPQYHFNCGMIIFLNTHVYTAWYMKIYYDLAVIE